MRSLRELVGIALLLCAGTGAAADWPELPLPEDAQGEWVSRHMIHNGIPMRAARFTSALAPQQLVDFYQRKWPGQTTVNELGGKRIVGHGTATHFTTIEISGGASGSEGQIGIVELLKETPKTPPGADFLKPSGTRVITDTRYLDNPGRTLAMEAPLSPFQSESFYRSRLPAAGWRHERPQPCSMAARSCTADYSRDKEQMTLTFNRNGDITEIVVNQVRR